MAAAVLGTLGLVAASTAEAAFINFDEDANGNPIVAPTNFSSTTALTTLYTSLGVTFSGPGGNDGGAILDVASNFGVPARSGRNFLAFNRGALLNDGGIPTDPESILFSTLVSEVSIWASGGGSGGTFTLTAFDASNTQVAIDIEVVASSTYGELLVSYAPGIQRVVLTSLDNTFVYDDLSFTPVPEPGSLALLGIGALGVASRLRRRGRRMAA